MSRNFAVLGRAALATSFPPHTAPPHTGEYAELIRRLFHTPSAVAIIGRGANPVVTGICEGLAAELAASGKRVVVVPVEKLLCMNPITVPDETSFIPGSHPNVWLWPSPGGRNIEFFKSRKPAGAGNWLDTLRRDFDSVLLDCPSIETTPGVAELAAMVDAAVLVVEAGRTTKQQIKTGQHTLHLRGAILAGTILIRQK